MQPIKADEFSQCANVAAESFIMAMDDCTSYIYCNGEDSFRDNCPDQTYFDAIAQECAFDDEGICLTRGAVTVESMAITEQSTAEENTEQLAVELATSTTTTIAVAEMTMAAPTTATSAPAAVSNRPHCDSSVDGYHAHPSRCEYYFKCISGYLTIARCPYTYAWDYRRAQCRPLSEAQCFSL
ncbi:CG33263 [Drosophila busckii]|uniref:CG33263 n=2 Tax=Drosophila busckii TaxID=30019 RepID=A0A0M5J189_DROBS|nr:CG33263 [Drosophila busckii]